jgi:hypothetical protein
MPRNRSSGGFATAGVSTSRPCTIKPPEKFEPLQVKFLSAVAKGERTLLVFELTNSTVVPIGYNGSEPKDSEILPNQKLMAPHCALRLLDTKTGKSRDLNKQTIDANATLPAMGKGRFEVPLPAAEWDELSVGIRWFEMRADPGQSGIAWSDPVPRKATIPAPADSSSIPPPAPKVKITESEPVAIGDWSEPVNGLRGRLLIARGKLSANGKTHESVVYLDLHHFADAIGNPLNIYFDPKVSNQLFDPSGQKVPWVRGPALGRDPTNKILAQPVWIRLPYDCTMRVRLSPANFGRSDGLYIPFLDNEWLISASEEGEFALAATFTSKAPADDSRDAWQGTLALPKMKLFARAAAVLQTDVAPASAGKVGPNRSYLQTGPDGVYYARCVPEAETGRAGTTKVYQVGPEKDVLVDSYDWYTPSGVVLGWSPIAGKVAVMARGGKVVEGAELVELSFHLGGKHLASYTAEDLRKLGVELTKRTDATRVDLGLVGCEQVPGTNHYLFVVEAGGKKRLTFDILTGKPRVE